MSHDNNPQDRLDNVQARLDNVLAPLDTVEAAGNIIPVILRNMLSSLAIRLRIAAPILTEVQISEAVGSFTQANAEKKIEHTNAVVRGEVLPDVSFITSLTHSSIQVMNPQQESAAVMQCAYYDGSRRMFSVDVKKAENGQIGTVQVDPFDIPARGHEQDDLFPWMSVRI